MKLAFISDIHGNALALDAVLKDIEQKEIDKIFVLGDLCFRGPEPKRSLELVKSLNTDVIKGNADEWVVRGVQNDEVPEQAFEIMNKERDWTYSKLSSNSIDYLSQLPTELNLEYSNFKIHAFHATPLSLFDVVQPHEHDDSVEEKLMQRDADLYIYGHIHKAYIRYINGKCIVNTGSVGLPFDGLNMASYVVVDVENESFQVSIVRVKYNEHDVIGQFKNTYYPNINTMEKILINARV
ncbi:phosphoesterase, MJ0936 family [Virgibacillus subterraneus]|uniref:Phosphoesterase n=1 Tax=Virgibacillus subterraneus TaxID=621109 RepID=A0A1H8ZTQ3_9BACI|nr:YfcE family phosphodiesterase [Virgibacillus subterraneus]SEP67856.1 phosphoesterase, MJ0936 family [Virgibacillus subterraneus]